MGQILDHWELYVQGDWASLDGQHKVTLRSRRGSIEPG